MRHAIAAMVVLAASLAHAAPITIGVFAPSAPFPSTAARVELANQLGGALGRALGRPPSSRVYARAADFAAAVKRGELAAALVDPAYLALAPAGATVVAVAHHGGEAERGWQLVARAGTRLADLRGKRVLVPGLGGREADFVASALFAGELPRGALALAAAPDTAAALATLALGKADAAVVPITELPAGLAAVITLPAIPDPVLVVYAAPADAVRAAALGFTGDATVTGFRAADAELVRAVARRYVVAAKRAPFAIPTLRGLELDALLAASRLAIERSPAARFVIIPP